VTIIEQEVEEKLGEDVWLRERRVDAAMFGSIGSNKSRKERKGR